METELPHVTRHGEAHGFSLSNALNLISGLLGYGALLVLAADVRRRVGVDTGPTFYLYGSAFDFGGSIYLNALCAGLGLSSALIRHRSLIAGLISPLLGKVLIVLVGAAALVVSPWIANRSIASVTLMRPSTFPTAYTVFSALAVVMLWAALGYLFVILLGAAEFVLIRSRDRIGVRWILGLPAFVGRVVGLAMLLFYVTPFWLRAANYDSGGIITELIIATNFVKNVEQEVYYASSAPDLPPDCRALAAAKKINQTRSYSCYAITKHCSNLEDDAEICFLSDTQVVVAKKVPSTSPLYELSPYRFDVVACDTSDRYNVGVQQR